MTRLRRLSYRAQTGSAKLPIPPASPTERSNARIAANPAQVSDVVRAVPVQAASSTTPTALVRPASMGAAIDATGRRSQALKIVERHAVYAAVGGIIPVPIANVAGVTAVIVRMVKVLSDAIRYPVRARPGAGHRRRIYGWRHAHGSGCGDNVDTRLHCSGEWPSRPRGLIRYGCCLYAKHRSNFRRALRKRGGSARSSSTGHWPSVGCPAPFRNPPIFHPSLGRAPLHECGDSRPRDEAPDAGRGTRTTSSGARSIRSSVRGSTVLQQPV